MGHPNKHGLSIGNKTQKMWENERNGLAHLVLLVKNEVPLKLKNKGTLLCDIFRSERSSASYSIFVEMHGTHYAWNNYSTVHELWRFHGYPWCAHCAWNSHMAVNIIPATVPVCVHTHVLESPPRTLQHPHCHSRGWVSPNRF